MLVVKKYSEDKMNPLVDPSEQGWVKQRETDFLEALLYHIHAWWLQERVESFFQGYPLEYTQGNIWQSS